LRSAALTVKVSDLPTERDRLLRENVEMWVRIRELQAAPGISQEDFAGLRGMLV
jgi:hypothetical protein